MPQPDLTSLAQETLDTFGSIAERAFGQLGLDSLSPIGALIEGNAFNDRGSGSKRLQTITDANRDSWDKLSQEPAIARLIIENDGGEQRILYIARRSTLKLDSGTQVASYGSVLGRLAELSLGDDRTVTIEGRPTTYTLIERTSFVPVLTDGEWDSINNRYGHFDLGAFSVDSFRKLLRAQDLDLSDALERALAEVEAARLITAGHRHEIRAAMTLRDQPILDMFQGEIFRLPLDTQLILLGPPGTGKTTTLIRRLGQKLNIEDLDERDKNIVIRAGHAMPHSTSWLMFTPSDLLKHYLKEAFSREQIPASDQRIKTWKSFRSDVARNTFGILRSVNTGKYTFKEDLDNLAPVFLADPRDWFEAFQLFHEGRLREQLEEGALLAADAAPSTAATVVHAFMDWASGLSSRSWVDIYRDLDGRESEIRHILDESSVATEALLKKERNTLFNNDQQVFQRLATWLSAQQLRAGDESVEEDELDDEEEAEELVPVGSIDLQNAVKAYSAAIRTLARRRYRSRTVPKGSRAAGIIDWLGERLPKPEIILEVGQRLTFQSGLRRYVNAFRRYVSDVPSSYRAFRRAQSADTRFYREGVPNPLHLGPTELDAIILLTLRNTRTLLSQRWIISNLESSKYELLRRVADLFRSQIMVDEATDFSALQLASMDALTNLQTRSFFACGDFNQRVTTVGVRSMEQLRWASPQLVPEKINLVYRQSRRLNEFAGELLRLQGGDLSAIGVLAPDSTHTGVSPTLLEGVPSDASAEWVAARISEVERAVNQMPTIAVLVNNEDEVRPTAKRLTALLEAQNLRAVPCDDGQALGEGKDVRVFDVQHIKGLEFEAVFFLGIDRLAEQAPELFDRYLYVGATRAATYLGLTCHGTLPRTLNQLRPLFCGSWPS